MTELIKETTDKEFDNQVLKSAKPVLIDFWAPWCGPCKAIGPVVEKLAESYGDRMAFFKCNVDENPVIPGNYGVRSIPTLIFIRDGQLVEQVVGAVPEERLKQSIETVLSGGEPAQPFVVQ